MIRKQIIATTGADKQNQQLPLEVLAEYAESIALQSTATRMSINHDSTILPLGKVLSGVLKQLNNGETALEVLIDDFADEFVPQKGPNGEILYFAESSCDSRPFTDFQSKQQDTLTIMINPLNFSREDYNDIVTYLQNNCHAYIETTISKSYFPNPEIVFNLVAGFFIATLGKQTWSKTSDKLSDAISDDFAKSYTLIKKIIAMIAQKVRACGQTIYIFTEPNQPVELVIKAKRADTVLIALETLKEYNISQKVQEFNIYTNGNLKKMQFTYDETAPKWEMSYLTTNTGQVIGTESNYKRTMKMYRSILESPTAGFSIGGTATFGDLEYEQDV